MTALVTATDTLTEAHRLIAALEQVTEQLPFAAEHLALHRPIYQLLIERQEQGDVAVAAWRSALATRWQHEVMGRRLFKHVSRCYRELFGENSIEYHSITNTAHTNNATPGDLLADLRLLEADLARRSGPVELVRYRADVNAAADRLELAINEATTSETIRRKAVLERRMAQEAYRRAWSATQRAADEFGGALAPHLRELFG